VLYGESGNDKIYDYDGRYIYCGTGYDGASYLPDDRYDCEYYV
jgi:hypothetical protein